jgi:choline-sulfatase
MTGVPQPGRKRPGFAGGRATVAAIALALAGLTLACRGSERAASPAADRRPRNVLIVVSDTLRADALACYDEGGARTPQICALAERGALFLRAYSNAPWTLPAAASMFSGNPSSQYALPMRSSEQPFRFRVPDGETLLAEALAERGYDRIHVIENPLAARSHNLQGFTGGPPAESLAPAIDPRLAFDDAIARNRRLAAPLRYLLGPSRRPFLLLQWIDDPHAFYSPPEKYLGPFEAAAAALPRPLAFYVRLGHSHRPARGEHKLRDVLPDLAPEERRFLHRLYLGEVESVDERVGYLLGALELSGRDADTLVVFTSDHGEGFGEHGSFLHGETFYDELLRVPLIVAGPGVRAGLRVATPVSLVDLMPTLAELLDVECLESPAGRSLAPLLRGETPADLVDRDHYVVSPLRSEGSDALVRGAYKLIASRFDRVLELYDLVADPGETRNLAAERPEIAGALLRRARDIRRRDEERRQATLRAVGELSPAEDEQTLREMKALGYLE